MLTDQKKSKLRSLFDINGIEWALSEIRAKRYNSKKKEFLQTLIDEFEAKQVHQKTRLQEQRHIASFNQQESSIKATWGVAIATIFLVIITAILVIITYNK